jgi:hypothetical protein
MPRTMGALQMLGKKQTNRQERTDARVKGKRTANDPFSPATYRFLTSLHASILGARLFLVACQNIEIHLRTVFRLSNR